MNIFEDDLPEHKSGEDLIYDMAVILIAELEELLAHYAEFHHLYGV